MCSCDFLIDASKDGKRISESARNLYDVCRSEIIESKLCAECYIRSDENNNWFSSACEQSHLLVWAKVRSFPFWPAKIMEIVGNKAQVRFFGQHQYALLKPSDKLLFSEESPNGTLTPNWVDGLEKCEPVNLNE